MKKILFGIVLALLLANGRADAQNTCTVNITVYVDAKAPVSEHDYDGFWHTQDFFVNLTSTDDVEGQNEIFYKINEGEVRTVSKDGQPQITEDGQDNFIEYWSTDSAGNEEYPHNVLQGIKLDKNAPLIQTTEKSMVSEKPVCIRGTVADAVSGMGSVELDRDGKHIFVVLSGDGEFVSNKFDIPDGETKINARVYDIAGNQRSVLLSVFMAMPILGADLEGNSRDAIVVNFGPSHGIWARKTSQWDLIHNSNAKCFAVGGLDADSRKELIIDFGAQYGIWVLYNDSQWAFLHPAFTESIIACDVDGDGLSEVIVDFGAQYGVWMYAPGAASWEMVHRLSPDSMAAGDLDGNGKDDIVMDFGTSYGIWAKYDNGIWKSIMSADPETFIVKDINADGKAEIAADLGAAYGIWAYYPANDASHFIHSLSPDSMTAGDINGDGTNEFIVDFGQGYGIWVLANDSWSYLHWMSPDCMITCDFDGNGVDELVIDFGTKDGIWVLQNGGEWWKLHNTSP